MTARNRRKTISRFENEKKRDKGFRINREINAPQVRVIAEDGQMLGVFPVLEAVRMAQDKGFDLIEVVPNATPPTCKIMDYGKYKYEQKKKAHESKKKQIVTDIKELQFRPRTDHHDVETKLKHARRFLEEGDKVKFSMRFRGREIAYQSMGEALMVRVLDALKDLAVVEAPPKMEGKQLFAMIAPDPVKLKEIRRKKAAEAKANGTAEPEDSHEDDGDDDDSGATNAEQA